VHPDERWMTRALALARAAGEAGDVPVGAVVVRGDEVLGEGQNRRERTGDPTGHAEIEALRRAAAASGGWRLPGCTLYVTLEPCAMCAGAALLARVDRIVFGAFDAEAGCCGTLYNLPADPRLSAGVAVTGGVLHGECAGVLRAFFRARRQPEPRML
jgi:tRNA(adenine34) deaminase